jgi:hypothetical protein
MGLRVERRSDLGWMPRLSNPPRIGPTRQGHDEDAGVRLRIVKKTGRRMLLAPPGPSQAHYPGPNSSRVSYRSPLSGPWWVQWWGVSREARLVVASATR